MIFPLLSLAYNNYICKFLGFFIKLIEHDDHFPNLYLNFEMYLL